MKITLKIIWNPHLERWVMKDRHGFNIYEFPDCMNFRIKYPDLDKGCINIVEDTPAQLVERLDLE